MNKNYKNTTLELNFAFELNLNLSGLDDADIEALKKRLQNDLDVDDTNITISSEEVMGARFDKLSLIVDFNEENFQEKQEKISSIFNNFSAIYNVEKPYIVKKCLVKISNDLDPNMLGTVVHIFGDKYTKIPKKVNNNLNYLTTVNEFKTVLFLHKEAYQDADIANKIFEVESNKVAIVTGDTCEVQLQLFGNLNFCITQIKSITDLSNKKYLVTSSSTGYVTLEQETGAIKKVTFIENSISEKALTVDTLHNLMRHMMISWVEKKIISSNNLFASVSEKLTQYLKHELTFEEKDVEIAKKIKASKESKDSKKKFKRKRDRRTSKGETHKPFEKALSKKESDTDDGLDEYDIEEEIIDENEN